jgi:hypothetical protein
MLSDCAISGLYMCVLKTDMRKKLNLANSSVFYFFQCGASGRSLLASGREWSPIVQTGPACVRTRTATIGRTVSKTVRMCATCLLVPNALCVRTMLMHLPDGDSTEAIYTPDCRILSHTRHNLLFGIL